MNPVPSKPTVHVLLAQTCEKLLSSWVDSGQDTGVVEADLNLHCSEEPTCTISHGLAQILYRLQTMLQPFNLSHEASAADHLCKRSCKSRYCPKQSRALSPFQTIFPTLFHN